MNTIKQLLRNADPLRHEPDATDKEKALRSACQAAAAAAALNPPAVTPIRRRRLLFIAAYVVVIGASLIGPRVWSLFVQKSHAAVLFELRLAEDFPAPGLIEAKVTGDGRSVYLHEEIVATNGDIRSAFVSKDPYKPRYGISVSLTSVAGQRMLGITQAHIGRPIAILIDNEVVMAPKVNEGVGDSIFISGDFTKSEAQRIVDGIQ